MSSRQAFCGRGSILLLNCRRSKRVILACGMVNVAQRGRALDCGSSGRGFKSRRSPLKLTVCAGVDRCRLSVEVCGCGGRADAHDLGSCVFDVEVRILSPAPDSVSYTHLRAHETDSY